MAKVLAQPEFAETQKSFDTLLPQYKDALSRADAKEAERLSAMLTIRVKIMSDWAYGFAECDKAVIKQSFRKMKSGQSARPEAPAKQPQH